MRGNFRRVDKALVWRVERDGSVEGRSSVICYLGQVWTDRETLRASARARSYVDLELGGSTCCIYEVYAASYPGIQKHICYMLD